MSAQEYPNQLLGVDNYQATNAGAVNRITAPLRLDTGAGVAGAILNSGTGVPTIAGNIGDLYIRIDGAETTYFYRCTTAGAAGAAVWAAMSGA